jgi:cytochrome c oxidase subunit 2
MFQKLLGLPINASSHGEQIDNLIGWIHVLMAVLFVGWFLLFVYMLFRFRKSRNPRADHEGVKSHASSYVEAVIVIIEIVLLVSFSIPFWAKKVSAFPTEDQKPVHVRVIGQQFAWNILYPGPTGKFGRLDPNKITTDNPIGLDRTGDGKDNVLENNVMHLPVNRPVIIELTTMDVIHSFSLPFMRVKQDTIPGMMIPLYFTPVMTSSEIRSQMVETVTLPPHNRNLELYITMDEYKDKDGKVIAKKGALLLSGVVKKLEEAGITSLSVAPSQPIEIACAQLCGLNHFHMKGFLTVESQAEYDKWLAGEVEDQRP